MKRKLEKGEPDAVVYPLVVLRNVKVSVIVQPNDRSDRTDGHHLIIVTEIVLLIGVHIEEGIFGPLYEVTGMLIDLHMSA